MATYDPAAVINRVMATRITTSVAGSQDVIGGFRVRVADRRLIWYFSSFALCPFVRDCPQEVYSYLDLYLRFSDLSGQQSTARIFDLIDSDGYSADFQWFNHGRPVVRDSDSDDAYAATFLSLVGAWTREHGPSWLRAHKPELLMIAQRNIVSRLKPSGLCQTFQDAHHPSNYGTVCQTMDNAEVAAGLAALSEGLQASGDTVEAGRMRDASQKVLAALWANTSSLRETFLGERVFRLNDASPMGFSYPEFNPWLIAQLWPILWSRGGTAAQSWWQSILPKVAAILTIRLNQPDNHDDVVVPQIPLALAAHIAGDTANAAMWTSQAEQRLGGLGASLSLVLPRDWGFYHRLRMLGY